MPKTNPSGIYPTEFKVLVLPSDIGEKFKGTSLLRPDTTKDRDEFAQMEGLLVAASPAAFSYAEWPEEGSKPLPGQKVLFARYAGVMVEGRDGVKYRIINDKDVAAVLD